jgi:hypothetical protein
MTVGSARWGPSSTRRWCHRRRAAAVEGIAALRQLAQLFGTVLLLAAPAVEGSPSRRERGAVVALGQLLAASTSASSRRAARCGGRGAAVEHDAVGRRRWAVPCSSPVAVPEVVPAAVAVLAAAGFSPSPARLRRPSSTRRGWASPLARASPRVVGLAAGGARHRARCGGPRRRGLAAWPCSSTRWRWSGCGCGGVTVKRGILRQWHGAPVEPLRRPITAPRAPAQPTAQSETDRDAQGPSGRRNRPRRYPGSRRRR